ncbi:MAG TPA: CbbX protein, partial [Burkholderiaceae bacterium]|nr:CbbX protein [Burkholderiaceae bacterium]
DYAHDELLAIGDKLLAGLHYHFAPGAREAFDEYLGLRARQPHFANARSVRNALDRARLRQASRLFERRDDVLDAATLSALAPEDIRASRVFRT